MYIMQHLCENVWDCDVLNTSEGIFVMFNNESLGSGGGCLKT